MFSIPGPFTQDFGINAPKKLTPCLSQFRYHRHLTMRASPIKPIDPLVQAQQLLGEIADHSANENSEPDVMGNALAAIHAKAVRAAWRLDKVGPVCPVLTSSDRTEIYYALEYKLTSPAVVGDARITKQLTNIMQIIGPDGRNMREGS
jgi:hypothetical protein